MSNSRRQFHLSVLGIAVACDLSGATSAILVATAQDLEQDASHALQVLYKSNAAAELLSQKAKGILDFPKIVKAGLMFGGSYGEGVLIQNGHVKAFYNSVSASWG